jgi:osmotically-inducible protein OsmY
MRSDIDIQRDVEAELNFRPDIDERDIAVKVNASVVTLAGFTRSYLDKQRAEGAVKRIAGVAGVANDIEVRLGRGEGLTDPEITRAAVQAIRTEVPAVCENVTVLLHHGHLTLEGRVQWYYLKEAAERAVRGLRGVSGVTNAISIEPAAQPGQMSNAITICYL